MTKNSILFLKMKLMCIFQAKHITNLWSRYLLTLALKTGDVISILGDTLTKVGGLGLVSM